MTRLIPLTSLLWADLISGGRTSFEKLNTGRGSKGWQHISRWLQNTWRQTRNNNTGYKIQNTKNVFLSRILQNTINSLFVWRIYCISKASPPAGMEVRKIQVGCFVKKKSIVLEIYKILIMEIISSPKWESDFLKHFLVVQHSSQF